MSCASVSEKKGLDPSASVPLLHAFVRSESAYTRQAIADAFATHRPNWKVTVEATIPQPKSQCEKDDDDGDDDDDNDNDDDGDRDGDDGGYGGYRPYFGGAGAKAAEVVAKQVEVPADAVFQFDEFEGELRFVSIRTGEE
jgi:hypothetical protein